MKVLTLTQPWASLMALGEKHYETRGWATSYRGPLAIHSAKTFPGDAAILCEQEPFRTALRGASWKNLPLGKILAVVELVDCIRTDGVFIPLSIWAHSAERALHEHSFGDYSHGPKNKGRYAWLTRDVRRLARPISAKGHLSLWEYPTGDITGEIGG